MKIKTRSKIKTKKNTESIKMKSIIIDVGVICELKQNNGDII
jgi:hypothetical protein